MAKKKVPNIIKSPLQDVHPEFLANPYQEKYNRKQRLRRIRAKREARALELRAKDKA